MYNKHSAIDLTHGLGRDRSPGFPDLAQEVLAFGEVFGRSAAACANQTTHQKLIKIIQMRSD